ncbi:DUF3224 domain-containing protein [Longimicrobium sp.]|uniref:DUF3224 domain-containing protein n=1 Tax=Longimicrobium sp. TaxID=2029185 RepID=UPI002C1DB842|nr:DUF3224 domain-containing protein [Longimicrobium sp.]HSU16508.1 DUF3224 domain-containing protein [Longimicrobium sp.]
MSTRATANFEITGWEQTAYGDEGGGPKLARATVKKTFRGDVEGTSTAELLMCGDASGGGAGYIAQEVVTATLGGRSGTFVLQHGGVRGAGEAYTFGNVVPDSATGELRGMTGKAEYRHDENGAVLTLDYDFAATTGSGATAAS